MLTMYIVVAGALIAFAVWTWDYWFRKESVTLTVSSTSAVRAGDAVVILGRDGITFSADVIRIEGTTTLVVKPA